MPKDAGKTEEPTPKRISDARKDGQVLVSTEVTSLATLAGAALMLGFGAHHMANAIGEIFRRSFTGVAVRTDWTVEQLSQASWIAGGQMAAVLLPPLLGIALASFLGVRFQVGHYFETNTLRWKPESLSPAEGMKRIMPSVENFVKMGLLLLKLGVIAAVVFLTIRRHWPMLLTLPLLPTADALTWVAARTFSLLGVIFGCFTIVVVMDYLFRRHQYYDRLMMSRQEIKDEMKELEGDPKVRGRQRRQMREMSLMRLMVEVPKADVVITNPTHVAVALRYSTGSPAPIVVAKGLRKRALRIKAIARLFGLPIVEQPALARRLYRATSLGAFIPTELFSAVAAVLVQLHRSGRRKFSLSRSQ